jgi:hypothetical protein
LTHRAWDHKTLAQSGEHSRPLRGPRLPFAYFVEPQPSGQVAAFAERISTVIAATVALEMIGPIPATLINRSAGMPARKNFELRRRSQRAISQARSL